MSIVTRAAISFFLGIVSLISVASDNTDLSDRLIQCGKFSLADNRLACFDALLAKGLIAETSVDEVSMEVVQPQAVQSNEVDNFAKEHLKATAEGKGLDSISSSITKLKQLIRGQWLINLENGQQWQQKDSVKVKLTVGDIVRMEKGAMGAVYLYKEDSHRNIRVKRLK